MEKNPAINKIHLYRRKSKSLTQDQKSKLIDEYISALIGISLGELEELTTSMQDDWVKVSKAIVHTVAEVTANHVHDYGTEKEGRHIHLEVEVVCLDEVLEELLKEGN